MTSINTNIGAMTALANLQATNKSMATLQDQVSTGLKIGSAKDGAATWSIAQTMRSDNAGFKTIGEGLSLAQSTVAIGRTAAESVSGLLGEIKDLVIKAQGDNVDHTKLKSQVDDLFEQISGVIEAAQFNGRNILNAANDGSEDMSILASLNRGAGGTAPTASHIKVGGQALASLLNGVGGGTMANAIDFSSATGRADALDHIETMIGHADDAAAALGSSEARIGIQMDFMSALSDTFEKGISALVDVDMTEASAELKALQSQQQLGVQSLAIANQAPQLLMQLFQ